jgi:ubiquinone/menaquinone biosynthesis C-methylase UbiE
LKRRLPDQIALQGDGSCLPLADESVDFLFCTETLEHISDPAAAVREFLRVLRGGCRFVVQSPNAHRIRNLNPFELLTLVLSLITDSILQPKIVHENTWLNTAGRNGPSRGSPCSGISGGI